DARIKGVMEIYEKFVGDDPRVTPMKIFPGMHYSMGGLYVTFEPDPKTQTPLEGSPRNQQTNIPGLFAGGEADHAYHGANRLGANSLLSCLYAGLIGGPAMLTYARNNAKGAAAVAPRYFEEARNFWVARFEQLRAMSGPENPYRISRELGDVMTENMTVVRHNDKLKKTLEKIAELKERWSRANALDTGQVANRSLSFMNQLWNMLALAEVMTRSALLRDESRGAHYKPEFALPEPKTKDPREDPDWMRLWKARHDRWAKTTLARHTPGGPEITYEDIPTPVVEPEPRWYA
ncbi:MAG TPA: FAD-binding protein, partial [Myxococcaceae bacterium]|nr:FAD-binding protein [Myxococcaceae bacterium]